MNYPHSCHVGTNASLDRLEQLIRMRLKPGADREKIDQRIWDLFGEEWAIMFTDLAGFSRRVAEFGIIHFLQVIFESQRLMVPSIEDHDGVLLKMEGDSMLIIFRSVSKSIECALAMQRKMSEYNQTRADTEKVLLCLGIGYGRVLRIGDSDVYGAEVNAASKLGEDTAGPWEILVTENVRKEMYALKELQFTHIDNVPPGAKSAYRLDYDL